MIQGKLTILKKTQVIDEVVYAYTQNVLHHLEQNNLSSQAEIFMIHLAMATSRQQKKETITALNQAIKQQLQQEKNYQRAIELWVELAQISPVVFHENELDYLHLHICTMLTES